MRPPVDRTRLEAFLEAFGRACRGPGRLYLVGGASALWEGWRPSTVDVDMKLEPEPPGAFEAIARLKRELAINVELASPDGFLPPLPGWQDRSPWIARFGAVDVHHYDFDAQALAKLHRAHDRDLSDVDAMARRGLVRPERLLQRLEQIEPLLLRYPHIEPQAFRERVEAWVEEHRSKAP